MSIYDYESELMPTDLGKRDTDWYKIWLLGLPTDELQKEYKKIDLDLKRLRDNEPAKKRGKKDLYRTWVEQTHDTRDLLNEIAKELSLRESEKD